MHNTAKHTPTGEVMAHFNLSDEEWDGLPSFMQQKLATVYCQHAAAPAMYEALKALVDVFPSVVKMTPYGVSMDISKLHDNAKAVLSQAEGR